MKGYEGIRDSLRENPRLYALLDAAQLVKHAFGLRSAVHRSGAHHGLNPVLFDVYAEPESWPGTGRRVDDEAKARHRDEIALFARAVAGDEVAFASCSYRRLLAIWRQDPREEIRAHADAVMARFSP